MDVQLPDGRTITNAAPDTALLKGASPLAIAQARTRRDAAQAREDLRTAIRVRAGDTLSLVGTNADGVALLMVAMARLAKGISDATTLEEMAAAAAPFEALTREFLAGVDAGTQQLPYLMKGDAATALADIAGRAHAAAQVFEPAPVALDPMDDGPLPDDAPPEAQPDPAEASTAPPTDDPDSAAADPDLAAADPDPTPEDPATTPQPDEEDASDV